MIPTSTNNGYNTMHYDMPALENLDIDYDGETTFGNYTITVEQDEMAESPREWDNLGTMVCWHRNYILGDVDAIREGIDSDMFWFDLAGIEDNGEDGGLERAKKIAFKQNIILPLYLYDHSGITMNTRGFSCQWDSGQVGWIHISLEKVRNEFSCKRVSKKMRERIETYLTNEVKTYDDYLTGNVYYFNIVREDPDGEEIDIDASGGYYGDPKEYMYAEIKSNIKLDIAHTPQQAELF